MFRSLNLPQAGKRLDQVDEMLVILIAHRMDLALHVGAYKQANGEPIYRKDKEDERLDRIKMIGRELGLNPEFAQSTLYPIIGESCKQQMIQMQGPPYRKPPNVEDEKEWQIWFKENLKELTQLVADKYDGFHGEFFASRVYLNFEKAMIDEHIAGLKDHSHCIDLGCATGYKTIELAAHFDKATGYDISHHMLGVANDKLTAENRGKVSFIQQDLDDGTIHLGDNSVSFVNMNLGTSSDIYGINGVIEEIKRVLVPGGRFFLSFYNRNALVYSWEFLPWPVSLAAEINPVRDCLDVHHNNRTFSIYARAYTEEEVRELLSPPLKIQKLVTFPALSPILPNCLFRSESAEKAFTELDVSLADSGLGAYILVTGEKEA